MSRNTKLLYCILGSAILSLSNNPIFERIILTVFDSSMEPNVYPRQFLIGLSNIFSLIGFLLLIAFSILLIVWNINLKAK